MWFAPLALVFTPLAGAQDDVFGREVAPFVERHCLECHGAVEPEGELALSAFTNAEAVRANADTWTIVRDVLEDGEMPPRTKPRPNAAELDAVIAWIDGTLGLDASGEIDPGRVTLRRLNRVEYENTVLDLVAVEFRAGDFFPADDVGHGFDNIGDVLSMPDILFEKYLDAAEVIAAEAIRVPLEDGPPVVRVEAGELEAERFGLRGNVRSMHTSGAVTARLRVEAPGTYDLRVRAFGQQAGPQVVKMELGLDGKGAGTFDVSATQDAREIYTTRVAVEPGEHTLSAAFLNDFYDPENADPAQRDRNMFVQYIELVGPLEVAPTAFQEELLEGRDAREAIGTLASRAFRRTATRDEVRRLLALTSQDEALERRVQTALTGMLVSPHFLFRVELHPDPDDPESVHELADHELASRLSYFLWSTMPDQRLLDLAETAELSQGDVLESEVTRMLRDARASALARHFAAQWLQFRNLADVTPDPERFPEFTDELRTAMRLETEMFFDAVLREGRPVAELLDADFTFLDERLAAHYDIPGVRGAGMRRVSIPRALRGRRGGLLSQGSILTVTSNPTRTSPVLRGKWILETLLDAPPPPPPPGIGTLEQVEGGDELSFRDLFERHRSDANCAVCHARMDPLGFGLENYDAIGAWRETDRRFPVDASGVLPDGRSFEGPAGLREVLLLDDAFERSLFRSLATYGLGRGLTRADRPAIDAVLASLPDPPTIADMIHAVIRLDAFQSRRGEKGDG